MGLSNSGIRVCGRSLENSRIVSIDVPGVSLVFLSCWCHLEDGQMVTVM